MADFFKANGFEKIESNKDNPQLIAYWEKWYNGGWVNTGPVSTATHEGDYSGCVEATEYWHNDIYWVKISSTGRDLEAGYTAENLKVWLSRQHSEIRVQYDSKEYIDLR